MTKKITKLADDLHDFCTRCKMLRSVEDDFYNRGKVAKFTRQRICKTCMKSASSERIKKFYTYDITLAQVKEFHEDKKKYMAAYLEKNKQELSQKRKEAYIRKKTQGDCPPCQTASTISEKIERLTRNIDEVSKTDRHAKSRTVRSNTESRAILPNTKSHTILKHMQF